MSTYAQTTPILYSLPYPMALSCHRKLKFSLAVDHKITILYQI